MILSQYIHTFPVNGECFSRIYLTHMDLFVLRRQPEYERRPG